MYRAAPVARPRLWTSDARVCWLDVGPDVLAFARGGAQCWVNTGSVDIELPSGASVLAASVPGTDRYPAKDAAVWLSND